VTYRLESALSREDAIRVAESLEVRTAVGSRATKDIKGTRRSRNP
jgi:hypothetical protein